MTIWFVVLFAATLTVLGAFLLLRLKADLIRGVDGSLESRAAQIALGYQGGGQGEFQDISDASLAGLPGRGSAAQLLSTRLEVLQSSGDPNAEQPMIDAATLARALTDQQAFSTTALGADQEPFRVLAIPAPGLAGENVLVVVASLSEINASVHRLLLLLLVAGPAALILSTGGGWWLARKALLPVVRMARTAEAIGMDRLDQRVAVPPGSDEVVHLARTLNTMLDRLELGVEQRRRFIADASHELRTPLAIMRAELDVSLGDSRLPNGVRMVLASTSEEVERIQLLVENLLTLARIDEKGMELLKRPLPLNDMVDSAVAAFRPLAEAKGIRLTERGREVVVVVDRDRLVQALSNLLDNAIRYTERGGAVAISSWRRGQEAGVTVSDTGRGIPADLLPRVFDRFFRVDGERASAKGGSGLGLAICREIVEAHGGRVEADSVFGRGSRFSIVLPIPGN